MVRVVSLPSHLEKVASTQPRQLKKLVALSQPRNLEVVRVVSLPSDLKVVSRQPSDLKVVPTQSLDFPHQMNQVFEVLTQKNC